MRNNRAQGFSLIELMIVVVVIGALAAIAVPNYQVYLVKTRRADAQGVLVSFANAMERYYTENNTYIGAAAGGANTGAPAAATFGFTQAPIDGTTKYYNLTIGAATGTTYTLRATPIGAQVGDGYLELLSNGARRWDKNALGVIVGWDGN